MALSNDLRRIIKSAELDDKSLQLFGSRQLHEALEALIKWVESRDTIIQWKGDAGFNGGAGSAMDPASGVLSVQAELAVTDADNVVDSLRQNASVTVTLTGTAAGKTINGVAGPLVVPLVDGKAVVTLAATGTGTIIATMSAPSPSHLAGNDVLTVTLS